MESERAAKQERAAGRWNSLVPGVLLALLIASGLAPFGWWRYLAIALDPSEVIGTVISTQCANNNSVSYSFPVNGTVVEGKDAWHNCRLLKPGDRVPVSFAASDPAKNITGKGLSRLLSETVTILIVTLLSSVLIVRTLAGPLRKPR